MLTLLARGGPPDSESGRNPLMAPSLTAGETPDLACCCDAGDPVWLLPWRLLAPPHHPAGHAKSQHRQHHADGTPQRPASHRQQCAGQGPDQRAVQQPGQLGLSWWMRVGAGHGARRCSGSSRVTQPVRRYPAGPATPALRCRGWMLWRWDVRPAWSGLVGSRPWPRRYSATATRSAGPSAAAP